MDLIIISIYDSGYRWSVWVNGEEYDRNDNNKNIDFNKIYTSNTNEIIKYLSELFYLGKTICKLIMCEDGWISVEDFINFNSSETDESFKKIICGLIKED